MILTILQHNLIGRNHFAWLISIIEKLNHIVGREWKKHKNVIALKTNNESKTFFVEALIIWHRNSPWRTFHPISLSQLSLLKLLSKFGKARGIESFLCWAFNFIPPNIYSTIEQKMSEWKEKESHKCCCRAFFIFICFSFENAADIKETNIWLTRGTKRLCGWKMKEIRHGTGSKHIVAIFHQFLFLFVMLYLFICLRIVSIFTI